MFETDNWPKPSGSAGVGVDTLVVTDPHRPSATGDGGGRVVQAYVWYPAKVDGLAPRPYLPSDEFEVLPSMFNRMLGRPADFWRPATSLKTASYPRAPVDVSVGRQPLVIFNHGAMSHALQNTALMEELASHGYVVASIGHPHESGGVVWDDGQSARMSAGSADEIARLAGNPDFVRSACDKPYAERLDAWKARARVARTSWVASRVNAWAEDSVLVADQLIGGDAAEALGPLADIIDPDRVAYVGMSYGGAVAARCCALDERCRAGINLDGSCWTWDVADRDMPVPFLMLHTDPRHLAVSLSALGVEPGPGYATLNPDTPLHSDLDLERHVALGERDDIFRLVFPDLHHLALTDHLLLEHGEGGLPLGQGEFAGLAGLLAQNRICRLFLDRFCRGEAVDFAEIVRSDYPSLIWRDLTPYRLAAAALMR